MTGCGQDPPQSGSSGSSASTQLNALANPMAVPGLIKERIGSDPTIRRLNLSDSGFSLEVRDPAKPENLDTYSYRDGRWTTTPVFMSMRDIEELDQDTFKLSKIDFSLVPQFLGMAAEGLELEGEELTGVSFDRVTGESVRVYVSVRGLRGSGHLLANADGTNAKVTRD